MLCSPGWCDTPGRCRSPVGPPTDSFCAVHTGRPQSCLWSESADITGHHANWIDSAVSQMGWTHADAATHRVTFAVCMHAVFVRDVQYSARGDVTGNAHLRLCRCDSRIWLVQEVARAAKDTLAGLRVCAARCAPAARRILHAGRHHVGMLRWHCCLPVRHRRRIAVHRCAHSRRQQAEPASQILL